MRVTIKDIARLAGVSDTTVSWVLKDSPLISKPTKEKVLKYVKELNYVPNTLARSLRKSKTSIIGVIINDITNPFYSKILSGIEKESHRTDYNILLCNTNWEPMAEKEYIDMLINYNVDGIIVSPTQKQNESFVNLLGRKIPFVFVDTFIENIDTNYVVTNTEQDGYIATSYLIELGHKIIGHVSGEEDRKNFSSFVNIIRGYKKALIDNNLIFDINLVKYGGLTIDAGYCAMKELLKINNKPTAVFAANDMAALGVMSAIEEAGLKIPEDISVIGIDNIYIGQLPRISLTTISEPEYLIGEKAVNILIDNITTNEKGENYIPQKIVYEPELIIRKSCGRLNK